MAAAPEPSEPTALVPRLWLLGCVGLLAHVGLLVLSFRFVPDADEPPLLGVLSLLTLATLGYFLALMLVLANADPQAGPRLTAPVLAFSVTYRLVLVPSWPIQEMDFYRYLWDGRVTLSGSNPYHFSPRTIREGLPTEAVPAELRALRQLASQSAAVQMILTRIHYAEVPTAYPPLAQLVFAGAALLTPADAPLPLHVLVLKLVLLAFDLGTLAVLVVLLRQLRLPERWCLAYGWCPLVLKEFANSGHFDAVAVFFTSLALLGLTTLDRLVEPERSTLLALGSLAALALGVLAKTYPLVLLPVLGAYLLARLGRRALAPLLAVAVIVIGGYLPFWNAVPTEVPAGEDIGPEVPPSSHPGTGLAAFLSQWEINDLLFMLVRENLREPRSEPDHWFVVVPAAWRQTLHQEALIPLAAAAKLPIQTNLSLLATQAVMGLILLILLGWWARETYRQPEPMTLLRCSFLSLAWSWLLSATQNPWYLAWCLPFMVFAGQRCWFLLPGLVLLYYVRFWIESHAATGTADAFDYGLVWLEYGPFWAALVLESWKRRIPLAA